MPVDFEKIVTPGVFATHATRGFEMPPHIEYIDRKVCDALNGNGSKRLLVSLPPRHGKSTYISQHLPAWFRGTYPRKNVLLTTYGANFSRGWGRKAKATLRHNQHLFDIEVDKQSPADEWRLHGHEDTYMFSSGVGGELTGKGGHLLVVDDPVKNAAESKSKTMRENTWDWWQSTAYTRIEPGGVAIVLMTRWHEDDLMGRIIKQMDDDPEADQWEVINFPAICESDDDVLGRKKGEALWPERYPIEVLNKIKKTVSAYWWAALYQQRPAPLEGGLFKSHWFVQEDLDITRIKNRTRAWDFGATEGDGDYTVGILMGEHMDTKDFWILDVVRGQWAPHARDKIIKKTTKQDGMKTRVVVEQEPGSSGKSMVHAMKRLLEGYPVRSYKPSGDKELRSDPLASQAGIGRLRIPKHVDWLDDLKHEFCVFPNGAHDDQVDAASMAFNSIHKKGGILAA